MPKNNNKKGKQKEVPTVVPAPPAPAPPLAPPPPPPPPPAPPQHLTRQPQVMTIDTIEEEDDGFGELDNLEVDGLHEDSWEQMHDDGDGEQEDLNGWAFKDENSNGGWAHDDAWETSAPSHTEMPPQPPAKDQIHSKSQKKQHQLQQHQHNQQQQRQDQYRQQPQGSGGWGTGGGAWDDAGNQGAPAPAKHHQQQQRQDQYRQQPQGSGGWGTGGGTWDDAGNQGVPAPAKHQNAKLSQTTQRAMAPAWSTWSHEADRAQGGYIEDIEEEDWSTAEEDPWGQPATGWNQQQPAHVPQAYAQHQPSQQSSWQTWDQEARRLPKNQQPYHAAKVPPGTGGYFHPQGAPDKQWSQQQSAMATTFQQQQEQAYALAQAQHKQQQLQYQHQQKQQQQQQQQQHQQQQEQAYALAQAQHRQMQQQQHQKHHQPQHQNHNQPHHQSHHQPQHQNYHQPQQEHAQAHNLHGQQQQQQQQQQENQHQPQHGGKNDKKNKENKQHHQSKKERKRQQQQQENDAWGLGEGWRDLEDDPEDSEMGDGWGRRVHFPPSHTAPSTAPSMIVENFTVNSFPPNKLGLSTYGMPAKASKTLAYAYSGTGGSLESGLARNNMHDFAEMRFVESQGAALKQVESAFFGRNSRMAKDRFHWMFPPDKDERVASLLKWIDIQSVSYGLGSFGLYKFLQTRERGALVVNADYRPPNSSEPAFDWLTYPELQKTMDRTLQESVAFYDPSLLVIIFVFLPSKSGNSLAIWRRKIAIPNGVRLAYQAQITQVIAGLSRDYVVHVDEIPPKSPPPKSPPKKRKWWKLWLA